MSNIAQFLSNNPLFLFIGIIVTLAGFLSILNKLWKRVIRKKQLKQKKIAHKIVNWYNYVYENLDRTNLDTFNLEKDINLSFKTMNIKKSYLNFSSKFQFKVIKTHFGLKKECHNKHEFIKIANLHNGNFIDINKTSIKINFHDYWILILRNYYNFLEQYRDNYKNIKSEKRKFTITDIEHPVIILKLYFDIT
jgi:hypothetical protein